MNLAHRIRKTSGGIWIIDADTHISKWVEQAGSLKCDPTVDRLLEFIPEGGVVVDAGANIGDHTVAYANKVGKDGLVMAIEPNPAAFCCLYMNCAGLPVSAHPFAIGNFEEMRKYHTNEENVGAGRFSAKGEEAVKMIPLDWMTPVFEARGRFDFFKLDIEGMEFAALCGAVCLVEKYHPVIYCEINDGALSEQGSIRDLIFDFLRKRGYSIEAFTGGFDMPQFDILCRPKK